MGSWTEVDAILAKVIREGRSQVHSEAAKLLVRLEDKNRGLRMAEPQSSEERPERVTSPPLLTPGHMGPDHRNEGWIQDFKNKKTEAKVRLSNARYTGGERAFSHSPSRSRSRSPGSLSPHGTPPRSRLTAPSPVHGDVAMLMARLSGIEKALGSAPSGTGASTVPPERPKLNRSTSPSPDNVEKALHEAKYHALFMHDTLQRALQVSMKTSARFCDQYNQAEVEPSGRPC